MAGNGGGESGPRMLPAMATRRLMAGQEPMQMRLAWDGGLDSYWPK